MIGQQLAQMRRARGWSQTELAQRAGLPSQHINQIESGRRRNPTWETLRKLAAAFGMPLDKLVKLLDEEAPTVRAA